MDGPSIVLICYLIGRCLLLKTIYAAFMSLLFSVLALLLSDLCSLHRFVFPLWREKGGRGRKVGHGFLKREMLLNIFRVTVS